MWLPRGGSRGLGCLFGAPTHTHVHTSIWKNTLIVSHTNLAHGHKDTYTWTNTCTSEFNWESRYKSEYFLMPFFLAFCHMQSSIDNDSLTPQSASEADKLPLLQWRLPTITFFFFFIKCHFKNNVYKNRKNLCSSQLSHTTWPWTSMTEVIVSVSQNNIYHCCKMTVVVELLLVTFRKTLWFRQCLICKYKIRLVTVPLSRGERKSQRARHRSTVSRAHWTTTEGWQFTKLQLSLQRKHQ